MRKEAGNTAVLVAAVVAGRPLREVAAMAELSVSSVQRRLKDPDVIADIKEERSRQRQETLGRFSQLRTSCIDRLAMLVDDANAGISLRAISLILNTTSRLDSTFDLEQRLTALEGLFEEAALNADDDNDDEDEPGSDVQPESAAEVDLTELGTAVSMSSRSWQTAATIRGWTMSVESRIRALDRARAAADRRALRLYRAAVAAVNAGTATIRQYRMVYGHQLEGWPDELAEDAVLYVARARLGAEVLDWREVAGYPPDAPLPEALQAEITALQREATANNEWVRKLRFVDPREVAETRLAAACGTLVLGDLHGVRFRRHLWRIQGTRWVLSQRARDAGQRERLPSASEADEFLGLDDLVTQAVLAGDITELAGGGVSYAELDQAVQRLGWAAQRWSTWSDQVRSGQGPSQPLCKDLQTGVHRRDCTETSRR